MSKRQLPILDISLFYSNRHLFVESLRSACHNVGFFLLKHDIPIDLVQQQLELTRAFFERPIEEKMQISYQDSPSFRGYMSLGKENTAGHVDYREQLEYAMEYDACHPPELWPPFQRLKIGKNPWPENPTNLKDVCQEYVKHVCRIADCVQKSLCLALKLEEDILSPHFENSQEQPHWVVKLVSYPVSTGDETSQGVGPHTDTNFLTLVLQDEVGGLEAFSEGEWLNAPSSSDVLVCNLGEQTQIWSQGYFLATPHRVVASSSTTRTSVPLFYNPALSTQIQPIDDSVLTSLLWERPKDYEERYHWCRKNNNMLVCVGENTFKSLARSHPEVFAKHHRDLMLLKNGSIQKKSGSEKNK